MSVSQQTLSISDKLNDCAAEIQKVQMSLKLLSDYLGNAKDNNEGALIDLLEEKLSGIGTEINKIAIEV